MGHFAEKFVRNEYFAILPNILGIFSKWGLKRQSYEHYKFHCQREHNI